MTRWLVPALALLALGWVALLSAAPLLPTPPAALLYAAGSLICHQISERSFHLGAFQLPVCARCFGLYAGAAIGAAAVVAPAMTRRQARTPRDAARTMSRLRRLTVIAAIPTAVTFVLEWVVGWPMSNGTRAVAGAPLGAAVAFVVVRALATLHYDECVPRRPIGHGQPPVTRI